LPLSYPRRRPHEPAPLRSVLAVRGRVHRRGPRAAGQSRAWSS